MLSRVMGLLQQGVIPVYVFDGKPPKMKSDELQRRSERRAENQQALD
jgi:flap endonuclease-1